jgi:hypothetical protein
MTQLVVRWHGIWWKDVVLRMQINIKLDPFVSGIFFVLSGIVVFMTGFLVQQGWTTAGNVTQIEMEKIAEWKEEQEAAGRKDAVYVHAYDKGFLRNWMEDVWPPTAKKHAPVPLCDPPPEVSPAAKNEPPKRQEVAVKAKNSPPVNKRGKGRK